MRNILLENSFDPSKLSSMDPARIEEMRQLADKLKYALIIIASVPRSWPTRSCRSTSSRA
jgi:hypothetical protein